MTAGDRFLIEFRNGASALRERVRILRFGWTGDVISLTPAKEPFTLVYTRTDPDDPLPESEAVIRVLGKSADRRGFTSVLSEVQGTADGQYPVVWETEETADSGTYQVRWVGFLTQQDYDDRPFADVASVPTVVSIRARDGIDLLNYRLYDPGSGGTFNVAQQIARQVAEATPEADAASPTGTGTGRGLLAGIDFLMNWRPWLPGAATPIGEAENPLTDLFISGAAPTPFIDLDGTAATRLDALRQLLGRFGLILFQSRGRWLSVQPSEYHPDAAGEVDVYRYDTPGDAPDIAASDDGTATALAAVVDSRGPTADVADGQQISFVGFGEASPARGVLHPVRECLSVYDFEPDLDDVISNGSFETAGATAGDAEDWTAVEYNSLEAGRASLRQIFPDDFTDADAFGAVIYCDDVGSPHSRLEQSLGLFLPGSQTTGALRIAYSAGFAEFTSVLPSGVPSYTFPVGGVEVILEGDTDYSLGVVNFDAVADATASNDATVYVDAIGSTVTGAVTGVVAIPKGTDLYFYDVDTYVSTLTLTEDALVGDTILHGRLTDNIEEGHDSRYWRWKTGVVFPQRGATTQDRDVIPTTMVRYRLFAPLNDLAGTPVSGHLKIAVVGGQDDLDRNNLRVYYDDVVGAVEYDGAVASEIGYQAALPTDAFAGGGRSLQLPARSVGGRGWLFGDGPTPDSYGSLTAIRGGTTYTTQQGVDTGWRRGFYLFGVESDERTIDALQAVEVLRTRGVHLERWQLPIWNQDESGAAVIVDPENVFRLWRRFRIEATASSGASYIVTHDRVRVGETLDFLSSANAVVESHAATDVTGGGPYTVTLDGTLSQQYLIGSLFAVARDYFWDRLVQNPGAGVTVYEGTELYRDDTLVPNEQILQQ